VLRPTETELGRKRGPDKFAPRTIDLDVLIFEEMWMQPSGAMRIWLSHSRKYIRIIANSLKKKILQKSAKACVIHRRFNEFLCFSINLR